MKTLKTIIKIIATLAFILGFLGLMGEATNPSMQWATTLGSMAICYVSYKVLVKLNVIKEG